MRTRTTLVVATTAVALAAGVGVGVAYADPTSSPTPAAGTSSPAGTAKAGDRQATRTAHRGRDLAARALHGEATLGGRKGTRVVDFQRGAVTAVGATSITVRSTDGFSATYLVAKTTKVRKDQKAAAIADVAVGDAVRVVASKDGSALTATSVRDRS